MPQRRYTHTVIERGTGRKFSVSATAATAAAAQTYADAKLALTVGVWCTGSFSEKIVVAPVLNPDTQYSDAVFTFVRGGAQGGGGDPENVAACNAKKLTIRMENVTTAIARKDALGKLLDGEIDGTNALVTALAAAVEDADGNTDYTFYDGSFVA